MNLRAVIIDDEMNSVDVLTMLLNRYCPLVEVVGCADSASAGKELIGRLLPDVVFLDIEMPLGSGFDLLDCVADQNLGVIFITAYDHYALKAIKYCALDYLLKPVDIDELVAAVNKVRDRVNNRSPLEVLN